MHKKKLKTYFIHISLFLVTLVATTWAGAFWIGLPETNIYDYFLNGFAYSLPFLGILTIHEFGHYFMARYYKVKVTLPYYIPLYLGPFPTIGSLGALIRMKSRITSRKVIFDIGIAGPLAGFIAALMVLTYGFTHLPEPEYIFKIHDEYKKYGLNYADEVYKKENIDTNGLMIQTGSNLVFVFFEEFVVSDKARIPNSYEMHHYPWLFSGFLALFFTALNLLPVGQLDGGHILYGLIGYKRQKIISPIFFTVFVYLAGLGLFHTEFSDGFIPFSSMEDLLQFSFFYLLFLYLLFSKVSEVRLTNILLAVGVFAAQFVTEIIFPDVQGFGGWLLFAFVVGRFLGVYHPRSPIEEPLDLKRKILGWISLTIFVLCFTPRPFL